MSSNALRSGRVSQINREYFITFNTSNKRPLFNNFTVASIFCQQIAINEHKHNCIWNTWVLMPDHFHGLLQLGNNLEGNKTTLSNVIAALKGSTAQLINKQLNTKGKVWQPSFYDHALRNEENRANIARYIVANPLRKKIVDNIEDYPYWNSVFL